MIFKKAVRTNHPQSTYDDTHESRNSRHIESGDKKQSEWKCNHVRSPHRARHDIASDVRIASCGASACISRRILNAASPATISIGASAYTTPVVACLRKDSHSTVLLEVMLMLLISLNCCGGHPCSTSSASRFQMGITSLNRGIYSAGLIPHLGHQKQTPPCDGA